MSTSNQTVEKVEGSNGFIGLLRSSLKAGLSVAENMHQTAVEIPLNMLQGVGVSEEQTSALKDKHRNLLRGMYGSIDSVASKFVEIGEEQASLFAAEFGNRANGQKAETPRSAEQDENPEGSER